MSLRRRNVSNSTYSRYDDETTPLLSNRTYQSDWLKEKPVQQTSTAIIPYTKDSWNLQFDYLIEQLKKNVSYLYEKLFQLILYPLYGNQIDESTKKLLENFKKFSQIPYDSNNPQHEEQLLYFWSQCFQNETLDQRNTKKWKKIGFQGVDPATDFRGSGIFGLKNMIYFSENYPKCFRHFLEGKHHNEAYPFAITSMNLTNLLFSILGWGMKPLNSIRAKKSMIKLMFGENLNQKNEESFEKTMDVFSELYCTSFRIFDEEWSRIKGSYMDFPSVMNSTTIKFENFVENLSTFEQLQRNNILLLMIG